MSAYSTCLGEQFEEMAIPFIAAINTHSPGMKLHVHIINPPSHAGSILAQIKRAATALCLSFTLTQHTSSDRLEEHIGQCFLNYLNQAYYDVLYLDMKLIVKTSLLTFLSHYHHVSLAYQLNSPSSKLPSVLWCRPIKTVKHSLQSFGTLSFSNLIGSHLTCTPIKMNNSFLDILLDVIYPNQQTLTKSFLDDKSIAIICRRIDLPFDKDIIPTRQRAIRNLQTDTRLYWQAFPLLLKAAYAKLGISVDLFCLPHGQITQSFVDSLDYKLIYVPHKNHTQIKDPRAYFYMQDIYPWFFTIDKHGWGPTHAKRASEEYLTVPVNPGLESFISSIKHSKTTKYHQKSTPIPIFDVFFPLQVPDDESILYGTEHRFKDIIKAVCNWAQASQVRVLFKAHPKAQHAIPPCLKKNPPYIELIFDGHIHDLIHQASVVFVANSSVGLEALFFDKPIVSFARSIYDQLTVKSDLSMANIQHAYHQARHHPFPSHQIKQWLSWYFFEAGCQLNASETTVSLPHNNTVSVKHPLFDELREHIKPDEKNLPNTVFPKFTRLSIKSRLKLYQALFHYMRFKSTKA